MTTAFSYEHLYEVIVNNDVDRLKKGILYLGAKIHIVHVWCNLTAVEYAAKLGHFEQVKLLLRELARYDSPQYKRSIIRSVFEKSIRNRKNDLKFVHQILIPSDDVYRCGEYWYCPMRIIVLEGAFVLLDVLVKAGRLSVAEVVAHCFLEGDRGLLQWIRNHQNPLYAVEVEKRQEWDPLEHAIVTADMDAITNLLAEIPAGGLDSDLELENNTTPPLLHREDVRRYLSPHSFRFSAFIAKLDDVEVFKHVVNNTNMTHLERILERTEEEILRAFWKGTSLTFSPYHRVESVNVAKVILSDYGFQSYCETPITFSRIRGGWMRFDENLEFQYQHLCHLTGGSFKFASLMKSISGPVNRNVSALNTCSEAGRVDFMDYIKLFDNPIEDFMKMADGLEQFFAVPIVPRDLRNRVRKRLCELPMELGRPDLVEPFRKFGVDYSEADVMKKIGQRLKTGRIDIVDPCDEPIPWHELEPLDFIRHDVVELCRFFLEGNADAIRGGFFEHWYSEGTAARAMLKKCVVESGRKLALRSRVSTPENAKEFFDEIERERRAALTLQKLARGAVRSVVRTANPNTGLIERIISLSTDHNNNDHNLPLSLVNYLLFRDEDHQNPLYHSCFHFDTKY